jgi:hypothetical protein
MSEFRRRLMMQGGGTSGKYIKFKDPVVEQICISKWSSDGIGLTPEDAAKVTDIGTTFKGNTEITSFDELEYFVNVKSLKDYAFGKCTQLLSITLPRNINIIGVASLWINPNLMYVGNLNGNPNITSIGQSAFDACSKLEVHDLYFPNLTYMGVKAFNGCTGVNGFVRISLNNSSISNQFENTSITKIEDLGMVTALGNANTVVFATLPALEFIRISSTVTYIGREFLAYCRNLKTVIVEAVTPPQLGLYPFHSSKKDSWDLFVPDESVEAYKSAEGWNAVADRIKPISSYVEPNE